MVNKLRQPFSALPLTFFDVETTGLMPAQGHRVCELALLRRRGTDVEVEFDTLINPHRTIDATAYAVNRISPEMLEHAPPFAAVADTVLDIIRGSVIIAHNAPFDKAFLIAELKLLNRPAPPNYFIDTLKLARLLLPKLHSYSLQSLASELHLPMPRHRAMQDVRALEALFAHLYTRLNTLGVTTLQDLLRCGRGLLPGQPEPVPPPLIDQALREGRLLRIIYRSRSTPDPTTRLIEPIELTQEYNRTYLRAYCFLRNDERSFAIDKIEDMQLVERG